MNPAQVIAMLSPPPQNVTKTATKPLHPDFGLGPDELQGRSLALQELSQAKTQKPMEYLRIKTPRFRESFSDFLSSTSSYYLRNDELRRRDVLIPLASITHLSSGIKGLLSISSTRALVLNRAKTLAYTTSQRPLDKCIYVVALKQNLEALDSLHRQLWEQIAHYYPGTDEHYYRGEGKRFYATRVWDGDNWGWDFEVQFDGPVARIGGNEHRPRTRNLPPELVKWVLEYVDPVTLWTACRRGNSVLRAWGEDVFIRKHLPNVILRLYPAQETKRPHLLRFHSVQPGGKDVALFRETGGLWLERFLDNRHERQALRVPGWNLEDWHEREALRDPSWKIWCHIPEAGWVFVVWGMDVFQGKSEEFIGTWKLDWRALMDDYFLKAQLVKNQMLLGMREGVPMDILSQSRPSQSWRKPSGGPPLFLRFDPFECQGASGYGLSGFSYPQRRGNTAVTCFAH
ncbi:hypothetical protein BCR34DRAFT_661706 [Clohesyomyces aquaticus]|uniref:F-box domain-containing protein n=1 Tax=Clohesyomyces aquaticus TaxID=1231657 RepID=A0A1Y2A0B7_9PLEO|nr:hypothetical protein BCR34DRAFT_661706 [Clohesyomyces aquaticus]